MEEEPMYVSASTFAELLQNVLDYRYMPKLLVTPEEICAFTADVLTNPDEAVAEAYKIVNPRRIEPEVYDYIDVNWFTSVDTTDEQRFKYIKETAGFTKTEAINGFLMTTYEDPTRYLNCLSCGQVVILAQDFIANETKRRCSSCNGLVGFFIGGLDNQSIDSEITQL